MRRHRTRWATALTALVLLLGAVAVVQTASVEPAAAHHCLGDADIDDSGGNVSATCHGNYPGGPPSATSVVVLFNAYCDLDEGGVTHTWSTGSTIEITYNPDPIPPGNIEALDLDPTGEYGWFSTECYDAALGYGYFGGWHYFTVTPPVPPEFIRDTAAAGIDPDPPTVETNPPLGTQHAVVNMDTWLWITDPWEVIHVTDTVGLTTVDVFARPEHVTWAFGDGGAELCTGPGVPWSESAHAGGTYCSHRFISSSAGLTDSAYTASATTTWIFSWALNGRDMGDFGSIDRTTTFAIQVGEIQAVESGG